MSGVRVLSDDELRSFGSDGWLVVPGVATAGHQQRWEATFLDPLHEYQPVRAAMADDDGDRLGGVNP